MKVFIERSNKKVKIKFSGSVDGLLKKLGLLPEECLVVRDSELLAGDEMLKNIDEIRVLSVVSGG